eukprot:3269302-Pleurochrysis_carterae.AAC.2
MACASASIADEHGVGAPSLRFCASGKLLCMATRRSLPPLNLVSPTNCRRSPQGCSTADQSPTLPCLGLAATALVASRSRKSAESPFTLNAACACPRACACTACALKHRREEPLSVRCATHLPPYPPLSKFEKHLHSRPLSNPSDPSS